MILVYITTENYIRYVEPSHYIHIAHYSPGLGPFFQLGPELDTYEPHVVALTRRAACALKVHGSSPT